MTSPSGDNRTVIDVVSTGTANIAAVRAGLGRLTDNHGPVRTRVLTDPARVRDASLLVLPGVGTFGAVMSSLHEHGLVPTIRERIEAGRPTLCICLGLQILAARSDESPDVEGFGLIDQRVVGIPPAPGLRVPQMGWNAIEPDPSCELLGSDEVYFANSFCLERCPEGWSCAWVEHGSRFVGAIERGPVLACQFHPELSGAAGRSLMQRWLQRAEASTPADATAGITTGGASC